MPTELNLRDAILDSAFTFTARPDPIPGDLRMAWGIAILLIAVFYSRGKRSNFQKLQFLAHAVRVPEGREEVLGLLSGKYRPTDVAVRVEPSLNRSVALASALKLVIVTKGTSIALTDTGKSMAVEIIERSDSALKEEILFLQEAAPKMTDALMKRVWRMEDLL